MSSTENTSSAPSQANDNRPSSLPGPELQRIARNTVQTIFQKAKEEAAPLVIRREGLDVFAAQLPARVPNPVIRLRLPSARVIEVPLRYNRNTVAHIQRDLTDRSIRQNRVILFIPGCNEPLPPEQDLRNLLPDNPEVLAVFM